MWDNDAPRLDTTRRVDRSPQQPRARELVRTDGAFPLSREGPRHSHGQHGWSIIFPSACRSRREITPGRHRYTKNVRNGVVMWKAAPPARNAFRVRSLSLPDAVSLQVFPLVVTRRCPRRCGRAAAIGWWRLLAASGGVAASAASGPLADAIRVRAPPAVGLWPRCSHGAVRLPPPVGVSLLRSQQAWPRLGRGGTGGL